ncbi:ribonuclease HI [Sinimarinibacterium sp. NLF-5-8]|uniref:ribonuclease HI n=1 Tax=Sinimarinibacterium sp. NLF-5-8 TaxID=2698684 RepID=UPI00137C15C8|nr:ribonuclease HI [Sinimarinibacterium sp. NLF-5-8]QHS09061.1 ribonuclease HI [Sinimarinibacterium sp. NLF-5-8]
MQKIVYTDGACKGNPGPGGWGVLIMDGDKRTELFGGQADTTNNRMEMLAVIKALQSLPPGSTVKLHSDSAYVVRGISEWLPGWKRNHWTNAKGQPVKNQDLWMELDALQKKYKVEWKWVRGHNGDPGNEAADRLANQGVQEC